MQDRRVVERLRSFWHDATAWRRTRAGAGPRSLELRPYSFCPYAPECVEGAFSELRAGLRWVASWLRLKGMTCLREAGREGESKDEFEPVRASRRRGSRRGREDPHGRRAELG